jgi:hypothetical protein
LNGTLYLRAVDPGAFSAMVPLWRAAVDGGIAVHWVAEGVAAKQLRERKIKFHPNLDRVLARASRSDTILFGARMDWTENIRGIKAATAKGLSVHFLFDHWCFYRENFLLNGHLILPNGFIFAIDAYEKRLLIQNGIASKKIRVVGHPAIAETDARVRTDLRRIKESPRRVLFFSEPIAQDFGLDKTGCPVLGYDEKDALRLLMETLASVYPDKYEILVKAHPREDVKSLMAPLKRRINGVRLRIVANGDPIKMIRAAKFVFGITTVLLLHAMRMGKVTGSMQPRRTMRGRENSNVHLERIRIDRPSDIIKLMNTAKRPSLILPGKPLQTVLREIASFHLA